MLTEWNTPWALLNTWKVTEDIWFITVSTCFLVTVCLHRFTVVLLCVCKLTASVLRCVTQREMPFPNQPFWDHKPGYSTMVQWRRFTTRCQYNSKLVAFIGAGLTAGGECSLSHLLHSFKMRTKKSVVLGNTNQIVILCHCFLFPPAFPFVWLYSTVCWFICLMQHILTTLCFPP